MNKVFDLLNEKWGENRGYQWLEENNIQRTDYRQGQMNGNACKDLLQKLSLLRSRVPKRLLPYIAALEDFNKVRISCFGQVLSSTYKADIKAFEKSYKKLGAPMTNKIHVLVAHVTQFCEKHGKGLGFYSEQARYFFQIFEIVIS